MNNSKKILIAVVIVALAGAGLFFALNGQKPQEKMSTFEKLEAAFAKQTDIKTADMDLKMNLDITGNDPTMANMLSIINDTVLQYQIKQDIKDIENPLIEGKFALIYQEVPALALDFFMDAEKMIFSLPEFYDKPMFMTFEGYTAYMNQMMSMYNQGSEIPEMDFDMKEMIKKSYDFQEKFYSLEGIEGAENFDSEKYKTMMETNLEGILTEIGTIDVTINENGTSKTVKCDGLNLNFNETQLIDFMIPLLEEAAADPSMKVVAIAKMEQYLEFATSLYGDSLDLYAGTDAYAEMEEAIAEMKENYESGIATMIEEMKIQRDRYDMEAFTVANTIGIDSAGQIIYWKMNVSIDVGGLEELAANEIDDYYFSGLETVTFELDTTMNSYGKDMGFTDYSKISEEGLDLITLMADPESQENQMIMMQIYGAAMQQLSTNPLFQAIYTEMGVY
jgi:hypothetical protein